MGWLGSLVVAYFVGVVATAVSLGLDDELLNDIQERVPAFDNWSIPLSLLTVSLSWPLLIPAVCHDKATQVANWWRARRALRRSKKFEDALRKKYP